TEGYRLAGHPLQGEIQAEIAAAAELEPAELETAVDGCGVVCFALPLERVAFMFSSLEAREGGRRIASAMRAHPQLVGGAGRPDTELMRALPGWIAKGGAEALFCAAGPDGLGIALKIEDGGYRALRPAIAAFLARLGHELDNGFECVPVRNSRGEKVGELSKEQVEDFYTYLIDHGVELVEGETHKHPPHEQPNLAEEEVKTPKLDLTVEPSLDSLRLYLREIGKVPLLTADQEVYLAK